MRNPTYDVEPGLRARAAGRRAAALLACCVLLIGACGGDDDSGDDASDAPGSSSATETTPVPDPSSAQPEAAEREGPATCDPAVALDDPADDTRSWSGDSGSDTGTEPAGDLRRVELRADERGVCTRWTLAAPPPSGTTVELVVHGPSQETASGGIVMHGHGFSAELTETGGTVTYGLDEIGSDRPRVLQARVGRSGRIVSVVVPRAELDRPPANMPDRPPFPYRGFSFQARVLSAPDAGSARHADFAPQEDEGEIGYVKGELCPDPCPALAGTPSEP